MYALTVRDLDAQTYAKINLIAAEQELPLSQVVKRLLMAALERHSASRRSDFSRFAGRWTQAEAAEFDKLTERSIDEKDWQKPVRNRCGFNR